MPKKLQSAFQVTGGLVLLLIDEHAYHEPRAWLRQRMARLPERVAHRFKG